MSAVRCPTTVPPQVSGWYGATEHGWLTLRPESGDKMAADRSTSGGLTNQDLPRIGP